MIDRARLLASGVALSLVWSCKDPPAPPPSPSASAPPATASAAKPPPPPIDGALPAAAPASLDRRAECSKETCVLTHVVPDEVRPALSDGAPAVAWEQAIAARSSVAFPRDGVVEVLGVVLDGSVEITAMEAAPKATNVGGRWSGFRAPGGGVTIVGNGGKAARVALVVATTEPGKSLGAHLEQRDRPGAPPSWNWHTRPKRVETFSFAHRPDLAWAGGAYHARVGGGADDEPAAVVDVLRFSASAGVAEHDHPNAWEILAVLEGDGALVQKPAGAEASAHVKAGSIVTIPAGVRHAWQPSGKAPLFALQVYAPPGPEKRFEKLAGKAR